MATEKPDSTSPPPARASRGLFLLASAVVLAMAFAPVRQVGLPQWMNLLAIGLMLAGPPLMLLTLRNRLGRCTECISRSTAEVSAQHRPSRWGQFVARGAQPVAIQPELEGALCRKGLATGFGRRSYRGARLARLYPHPHICRASSIRSRSVLPVRKSAPEPLQGMDWAMRRLALACTVIALATAACSGAPDQATAPAATKAAGPLSSLTCSADPASITALSIALFPGGNQNAVLTRWLQIADLLSPPSPYDPVAANSNTYSLVDYILSKYSSGQTIGGPSPANEAKVTSLVNQIFCYSGIDATLPGLGPDDGAGLYGPNSPATLITTGNKQGGVQLPAGNGNVTQQTLITIHRRPDFPGPLLTPLDQFPLYYEFNSSSGEQFNFDAVVGVCTIAPDFSRLRVAHNVPEPTPNTIEILSLAAAPFLDCSNASLSLGPNASLREFANWGLGRVGHALQSVLMPAQLSAASVLGTGGLAGTAKKFSPFGTVDTLGFETGAAPTSGQSAPEGGTVATTPAVQIKTTGGVGVKGITVTFSVTGGGGTLTPAGGGSASSSVVGTTDDTGYVTTGSWTVGTGTNTVNVVATPPHPGSGIDPLTGVGFTATANPPVKLGYSVAPTDQTAGTAFGVTVLVQD